MPIIDHKSPLTPQQQWKKNANKKNEERRMQRLATHMNVTKAKDSNKVVQVLEGLASLDLSDAEICLALNQQSFNERFFKESMDIVSNSTVVSTVKLQSEQKRIEKRLASVRAAIETYGEFQSEERMAWVKEEDNLLDQWRKLGELLVKNQDVWYRGAAYLAVIKSKVQGGEVDHGRSISGPTSTQRTNKPGFRPTVIVTQNEPSQPQPEEEPQPAAVTAT